MHEFTPIDLSDFDLEAYDEAAADPSALDAAALDEAAEAQARRRREDDAALLTTTDLRRLLDVVSQLNAVGDPAALLTSIIETAADLLDCAAASLLLYDETTDRLRFVAATGSDTETLAAIPVPLYGSIAGTIFREGVTINIPSAQNDLRHYDEVGKKVDFETQSLLGVPMHIEGRVVGVLEALNKHDGPTGTDDSEGGSAGSRNFDRRDEHLLGLLADQMAVTLRNVRQQEAVRDAYERLAQIEATKSNFLTLTSHELRTPLATIRGFAEILQDEAENDHVRDFAALIRESTDRMAKVVDVMGELSELRMGRTRLSPEPRDLADVLERARQAVGAHAEAKRVQVRIEPPAQGFTVCAHAERLDMALLHLMTNAVTFTPEGGGVTLRAYEHDGGVVIQIEDTGCGLAPEHREAIFREYFQVENALTRSHGGLGLGLTVVRGIAELHGGRVWAESPGEGRGSVFSLWLPGA
ncbi:MAG: GAF domain-containing sensor histidine kinase [Bacteroidota bacterium]